MEEYTDFLARLEQVVAEWRAEVLEACQRIERLAQANRLAIEGLATVVGQGTNIDDLIRERDEAREEAAALRERTAQLETGASEADHSDEDLELTTRDEDGNTLRIGEILHRAGLVTLEQLDDALEAQSGKPSKRLGNILVEKGYAGEDVIARVLANQLGFPFVNLHHEHIEEEAVKMVGRRIASMHHCIPIRATEEEIVLALSNPLDLIAVDDVELTTSRRVIPMVATASDIGKALRKFFGEIQSGAWI